MKKNTIFLNKNALKFFVAFSFILLNSQQSKSQNLSFSFDDSSQEVNQNLTLTNGNIEIENNVAQNESKFSGTIRTNNGNVIINNNSGDLFSDAISASKGQLSIVNNDGATISSSSDQKLVIDFSDSINSSVVLNGGEIDANLMLRDNSHNVIFNGGNLQGSIIGQSFKGNVVIQEDLNLNGKITGISTIEVKNEAEFNLGNNEINVAKIILGENSSFNLQDQATQTFSVQEINGASNNQGSLNLNNNTLRHFGAIGNVNSLKEVNIESSSFLIVSGDLNAQNIRIGSGGNSAGSNLLFFANGSNVTNINSENIVLENGKINLLSQTNIFGDISAANNNALNEIILFNAASYVVKNYGKIGSADFKIFRIHVGRNSTFDTSNGGEIYANEIFLSENSNFIVGSNKVYADFKSSFDSSGGKVLFNEDNQLNGNLGSLSTQNQKNINAEIAANKTLNTNNFAVDILSFKLNENSTLNIANNDLVKLNSVEFENASAVVIGQNSTFNVANGANLNSSIIKFNGDNSQIIGNVVGDGFSEINLGSYSSRINGDLTLKAGDILSLEIANLNKFGNLQVDNSAKISQDSLLNVALTAQDFFAIKEKGFVVVEGGDDSVIEKIKDENVNVNNSGSNNTGLVSVSADSVDGDKLVLNVAYINQNNGGNNDGLGEGGANNLPNVSDDKNLQGIFNNINQIGGDATNELSQFQDLLLVANVSNSVREDALRSLVPNDIGLNRSAFAIVETAVDVAEERIDTRRNIALRNYNKNYKTVNKKGKEIAESDDSSTAQNRGLYASDAFYNNQELNKALWAQIIGSSAKQGNKDGFFGFEQKLYGISFGADKKIDNSSLAGASFTISDSQIESSDNLKRNDIQTYQISFYGEKIFDNRFFVDGFINGALNKYESTRNIPLAQRTAKAKFDGQTYSAKLRGGYFHILENDIEIFPEISLNYAYNDVENYQENGAGTLNLQVSSDKSEMLEGEIGLGIGKKFEINSKKYRFLKSLNFTIDPKFRLSYGYDFIGNAQTSRNNFVGQNIIFITETSRVNREVVRGNFGLNIYSSDDFMISANYVQERRELYKSHSGLLKFRWGF